MAAAERSWTDAITNAALLGGFDAAAYLAWLTQRATRIEGTLPQFLHEFTHHWCFDSLVGNAISQLVLRARRNALVFGLDKRFGAIESDVLRATAAELMLQPLSEGLALFAEFDITPGPSPVESGTMSACLVCFGFPINTGGDAVANTAMVMRALLQTTRRLPAILERKAGIYAQAFECEAGYLAGYLSVKALWAQLASMAPALYDRDLYLGFMRSYIYDDAGLVLTILDRSQDDHAAATAVATHIFRRLAALAESEDLQDRLLAWEAAVDEGRPVFEAIGISEQEVEQAQTELMLLMDDVQQKGLISDLAGHAMMTLEERHYLTLGALPATATHRDGVIRVQVARAGAGAPVELEFEADDRWPFAPSSPLSGDVVVVTPSRRPCVLIYFTADKKARLVHSFGFIGDVDQELAERLVINRRPNAALHDQLEAALTGALSHPDLALSMTVSRRAVLPVADDLYGRLATLHAEDDAVAGALARLRRGGLYALLDEDAGLVRGVASIGLANTQGTDSASLAMFARLAGLDDATIERTIADASVRHGMRLLARGNLGGIIAIA